MSNHHEIEIHLVNGNVRVDKSKILRVGDTVRYSSPDGKARVFFPSGSPYRVSRISDTHKHTVKKPRKESTNTSASSLPVAGRRNSAGIPRIPRLAASTKSSLGSYPVAFQNCNGVSRGERRGAMNCEPAIRRHRSR